MKVSIVCHEDTNISLACLVSLINQTLDDIEIILPNEHNFRDSRVTHGITPSGEYLLLTDMQCIFSPNMLAVMTDGLDRTRSDLGICGRTLNGKKAAVTTTVASSDDKKFALAQRLINKRLLFTPNNAIVRNSGSGNFIESCVDYVKNASIYCFSNAFISGGSGVASKEHIFDILEHFLSRRP